MKPYFCSASGERGGCGSGFDLHGDLRKCFMDAARTKEERGKYYERQHTTYSMCVLFI